MYEEISLKNLFNGAANEAILKIQSYLTENLKALGIKLPILA